MSILQATSESVQAQERLVYELKLSKENSNGMMHYKYIYAKMYELRPALKALYPFWEHPFKPLAFRLHLWRQLRRVRVAYSPPNIKCYRHLSCTSLHNLPTEKIGHYNKTSLVQECFIQGVSWWCRSEIGPLWQNGLIAISPTAWSNRKKTSHMSWQSVWSNS